MYRTNIYIERSIGPVNQCCDSVNRTFTMSHRQLWVLICTTLFVCLCRSATADRASTLPSAETPKVSDNGDTVRAASPMELDIATINTSAAENVTQTPKGPTLSELASKYLIYKVGYYIQTVCVPIFVCIGLVGNFLSFIVMIQPQNRRISCCIYMATVAVCDSGVLIDVMTYWVSTDGTKVLWTDWQCKLSGYFFSTFAMISVVLVTFVTADRFIVVRFPLRARHHCTPSRAYKIIIPIIVLVSLCQLPHLHYFAQVGRSCQAFGVSDKWAVVFVWFNTALNSLIPVVAILIMNGLIMMTIRNRAKAFRNAKSDSQRLTRNDGHGGYKIQARERQLVSMLLLVTTALPVFTIPQYIRYISYLFIDYTSDPRSFAIYFFWYNLTAKWFYINYAINFYLYCIGGRKFRGDLKRLLCFGKSGLV